MAATDAPEQTPFLKQLASSDKKARDQAVESIRTYLSSGREFSQLELMKLWRGLFFCMWHSDRPLTQQTLASTLSSLLSSLPQPLFIPFMTAFYQTIILNYTSIDSLRMDKFLLLIRRYINAAFTYLQQREWDEELLEEYLDVVRESLMEREGKVADGLRYHVLDCWGVEFGNVIGDDQEAPVEQVMSVVDKVAKAGRTKVLRQHAKTVLADERVIELRKRDDHGGTDEDDS